MDKSALRQYNGFIRRQFLLNHKELFSNAFFLENSLSQIEMTKEQVESENKNPFVRKTLFGLIKLFVGVIAIALLVFIIRYFDYHTRKLYIALACIFPIFISLMARSIAENAMNISAFKEAKKRISESIGIWGKKHNV